MYNRIPTKFLDISRKRNNFLLVLGCLLLFLNLATWATWHLWLAWLGISSPVQLGIRGGRLQLGIAYSGQLGTTFGRLGLVLVQLDLSSCLACLPPLCCVGGHTGMLGIWSGRLGHWPGISLVQVGQFQLLSSLLWW